MIKHTLRLLLGSILALLPSAAAAYELPGGWAGGICSYVPCHGGGGAMGLSAYLTTTIVFALETGFIAIAGITLFISSITLITAGHDENTASEVKRGYNYIIAGGCIVALAHLIVEAFSPTIVGAELVNTAPLATGFNNAIFYFRAILGIAATVNVVYQGVRLITAQAEDQQEKARKRLLHGFIGVGIVLLANAIVGAFAGQGASVLSTEIVGITNFLLSFFGVLAVLAIIVAGVMLIISIDEGLKDKAKTIIKTSLIAVAIVISAYAIVSSFASLT